MKISKKILNLIEKNKSIRLDLGCGENKQPNFIGMDNRKLKGVDIVHDVEKFPFPLPKECCSLVVASHLVEHIEPHGGVFMRFMDEVWRIMKVGGEFMISCPYYSSPGFAQDPTHCNMISEVTWEYFSPVAPNSKGMLWQIYKPKPWRIKYNTWNVTGNLEIVLVKMKERRDGKYE